MTEDINAALGISARAPESYDKPRTSGSSYTENAMRRYRDGYLHARTINGIGEFVKTAAGIIAILLVFLGLAIGINTQNSLVNSTYGGIAVAVIGLIVGCVGYIAGVLIQSLAQSMKAHFDTAVNGSPFLTDDQRAKVMSL